MLKKVVFAATLLVAYVIFSESCVYHKGDQQYPYVCDTTDVHYSVEITAILYANCYTCHNENGQKFNGINLFDYPTIRGKALDGKFKYGTLLSAVMHQGGAPEMPQNGPMLQQCEINKIAAWVHMQAPNN